MYYFHLGKWLLIAVFVFVLFNKGISQETVQNKIDNSDLYSLIEKNYGSNPVAINGIYHEDYYRNAIGHPFLNENQFVTGYVVIHNKRFDDIQLKYNVYNQNIVIRHDTGVGNPLEIIPPNEFISEFRINGRLFRKYRDETGKEKFFQVVHDGSVKCLFYWSKERTDSFHDTRMLSYRFNEEVRKSYMIINHNLLRFKSKGNFFNLFPAKYKPELITFCRKEAINPVKSADAALGKLIGYYEKLIDADHTGSPGKPDRTN